MEFLGTLIGHGKEVSRKGTKKSGLTFTAEAPDGIIKLKLDEVEGVTKIKVEMSTSDHRSHTFIGTFEDFCNEVHKNA